MGTSAEDQYRNEGLSRGYRFFWKLEWLLLHVYGPAQLSGQQDPRTRKEHERRSIQARARAERLGISEAEARDSIMLYSEARRARQAAKRAG
jgi:hypothetical protein